MHEDNASLRDLQNWSKLPRLKLFTIRKPFSLLSLGQTAYVRLLLSVGGLGVAPKTRHVVVAFVLYNSRRFLYETKACVDYLADQGKWSFLPCQDGRLLTAVEFVL